MDNDPLSLKLEEMLADYEFRVSQLQLDIPPSQSPPSAGEEALSQPLEAAVPASAPSAFDAPAALEPPPELEAVEPQPREEPLPQITPPQDVPRPARPSFAEPTVLARRRPLLRLTALTALAAAVTVSWFWARPRLGAAKIHNSYPLPYANTVGLAVQDKNLLSVDPKTQSLLTMDVAAGNVRVKSVQKFSNPSLSAFALGQGCFWSSDNETGFLYQHNLDPDHSLRRAHPNALGAPSVLYNDGRNLWSNESQNETIFQHTIVVSPQGDRLVLAARYRLPAVIPAGFHASGDLLWVLDSISRKLYRFRLGQELIAQDWVDLNAWLSFSSEVTAFAADSSALWVITQNPAELHRFELKRLSWSPSAALPEASGLRAAKP